MNEGAKLTQPSKAPTGGLIGAVLWPLRVLKRIYAWMVGWADTKWGLPVMLFVSFADSSFFPVPPDPLLIAMCLGKRKRALLYGALCTLASVVGGIAGWYIGQALFHVVADVVGALGADAKWFGTPESAAALTQAEVAALPREGDIVFYPDGYFYLVQQKFAENAFLAYFSAALSPIPYKVFTIAGGVFNVSLAALIIASVAGRGLRFFGMSVLIFAFGNKVKPLIEKYFEWITIAVVVLLALFFLVLRYVM
ncbi:MAG: DedA family protein [Planctomycetes bacterium]|nr:DedA family protein [Planctomycetota bacterium]MCW8135712.1 DedA family protein [Planctomycetota bacterium]